MSELLEFLGRLHPLVLHLPIGLLFGALLLELFVGRGMVTRGAFGAYLWLAAVGACVSASTGWLLHREGGYAGETVEWHERLGIAVAVASLLAALVHDASGRSRVRITVQRVLVVLAAVLLLPAGHLGSQLTHGADWLEWPERVERAPADAPREPGESESAALAPDGASEPAPPPEPAISYSAEIAPVLAARCSSCHGSKKRKGALRLDSPAGLLAGGDSGPALVPGDVAATHFLVRARLPLEHEDHMPPEGKPQPTPEELDLLERWVAAGAPFDAGAEGGAPAAPSADDGETETGARTDAPAPDAAPPEPSVSREALAALEAALIHHERLRGSDGSDGLAVDVAAVATAFDDAAFERLLVPLADHVVELSLARSAIGDASLARLAEFPRLARLDVRATAVTTAGIAALAGHAALTELVLVRTRLDDGAVAALAELPALERVALWDAGLSAAALAELRARPGLAVDAGDTPSAAVLESEGELAFSSDRPLPGAELVPEALRPVNATCPVSGSPVNPKYSVVHDGAVVGFCCPNCPKEFWADPARFAVAPR